MSNSAVFFPTNGEISNRYPTLIAAAGYGFVILGPIFLLDVIYGTNQLLKVSNNATAHRPRGQCTTIRGTRWLRSRG